MASQALYRKWRSQTFRDLIGQEAVVRTLKNALQSGRIAHAYLFCGPRGTGKTSAARLLAKTVNCQNPQDGEPCNECLNCREITENRSLDVIEIDAASNRGIDEIRELRSKVGFSPGSGTYKVYVLDEAHMLTTDACNALLKTLEEPPPHVIFVLATTEAHRILPTILSRCQRLDFKRFSVRDIIARLEYVAQGEGVNLEPGAADLIARAAAGGMRDALSLLDQAIAALGETVTLAGVQQMLGLAEPGLVRELVEHIAYLRGAEGLHLINRLAEAGADLRQLSAQVAEYWRALLLSKAGANIIAILDRTPEEAAEIARLAELFALDELSACARIFSQNDVGARSLSIPQLAVELAFVDCLHLHRQRVEGAGAVSASSSNLSSSAPGSRSALASSPEPHRAAAPAPAGPAAPARSSAQSPLPSRQSTPATSPVVSTPEPPVREEPLRPEDAPVADVEELDLDASASAAVAVRPRSRPALSAVPADIGQVGRAGAGTGAAEVVEEAAYDEEEMPARPVVLPGLDLHQVTAQWDKIKKACKTKSPKLAALLNHAHPVAITGKDGSEVVVQVEFEFHYKKLLEPANRAIIEWALKEILDRLCYIRFIQKHEPIPASTVLPATSPVQSGSAQPQAQRTEPATQLTGPDSPSPVRSPAELSTRPTSGAVPAEQQPAAPAGQNGHRISPVVPGVPAPPSPPSAPAQPKDLLEERVRRDPVVDEIIRTYGAHLIEWKPIQN